MKRNIALICAVFIIANIVACRAAPQGSVAMSKQAPHYQAVPQTSMPRTPVPSAREQSTTTPAPAFDTQWYCERNEVLEKLIRQYRTTKSEEEIEREKQRLAIDSNKPMVALTFDDGPIYGIAQLMYNYQHFEDKCGQIRTMQFNTSDRSITVTTYSPVTERNYRDYMFGNHVFMLENAF